MYIQLAILFIIILGFFLLRKTFDIKLSSIFKTSQTNESVQSEAESNGIPADIIAKLKNDYPKEEEYKEAIVIINYIKEDDLNVGWTQLSRAIILIANGEISKMKEIVESDYGGDPRDVIMEMMSLSGVENDHGTTPFPMN